MWEVWRPLVLMGATLAATCLGAWLLGATAKAAPKAEERKVQTYQWQDSKAEVLVLVDETNKTVEITDAGRAAGWTIKPEPSPPANYWGNTIKLNSTPLDQGVSPWLNLDSALATDPLRWSHGWNPARFDFDAWAADEQAHPDLRIPTAGGAILASAEPPAEAARDEPVRLDAEATLDAVPPASIRIGMIQISPYGPLVIYGHPVSHFWLHGTALVIGSKRKWEPTGACRQAAADAELEAKRSGVEAEVFCFEDGDSLYRSLTMPAGTP